MKRIKQWASSRGRTPSIAALILGLSTAIGKSQEEAGAAPLVAKPVEIETGGIITRPKPQSAVAAVPIPAPAEDGIEAPEKPRAPDDFKSEKPLSDFSGDDRGMSLRNTTDLRRVRIPVPWRAKWPEMRIDLRYQNSGALIPQRSQLELWWAGGMITQRALDGEAADGRILTEIPNRHLRPGVHPLEIRALQQTAEECGDPFGEGLWTQIDTSASSVTLKHQLRSLTPVLSDFPRLMDRYGWDPFRLRLVTAEPWALTEIHLEWMARVIERSALLLESVPMEITHGSTIDPAGDHIVIGLRDEIVAALPESIAAEITESFVGIFPHPRDDRFFIAVISGTTREGIEKSVRAFAATEFGLPPDPVLDLTGVSLPELPPGPPHPVLQPGEERSFAEAGGRTWEMQGLSTERAEIPVQLPAGIAAAGSANLKMKLRMAWSPVRRDATVDVFVNGNREATIPIGKADSPRFEDYEMELSLGSFHPGKNRIAFQPNLVPPNAEGCEPVNWDSLRFVLKDDSRLKLPVVDREIKLPDLELTARSAIPAANLAAASSPQSFTVFMSDRESSGISAGCTLLGKFIQTGGRRVPLSRLSFERPPEDSNFVAVGSEDTLPDELFPAGADFSVSNSDRALIAQFESPLKEGRIGMVISAAAGVDIGECVRELVQPNQWERLSGDTMKLGKLPGELATQPRQFATVTIFHDAVRDRKSGSGISPGTILYPLAILLLAGVGATLFLKRERRRNQLPGRVSIDAPLWSLRGEDRI